MTDFTSPVVVPAEQQVATVPAETVTVPERTTTITMPERTLVATVSVDVSNLRTLLRLAGFPDDKVDVAQAIAMAESQGYADAVGDLTITSAIWGPSIGLFQIRSLKSPPAQNSPTDLWRWAWPLKQPFYNAQAALAISKGGTDWAAWSVWTSKSYEQYLGGDPVIKTGHAQSANWWK
jgi:hypothetical protein